VIEQAMPRTAKLPAIALTVSLLLLLVALIGIGQTLDGVGRSAVLVERGHRTIEAYGSLLSTVKDAETGQRGYLLTGRVIYLQPYETANKSLGNQLANLRGLAAGDPDQTRKLSQVTSALTDKTKELARTVELARAGDRAGALAVVETNAGKVRMDRLRRLVGELVSEQRSALAQRRANFDAAQRRALLSAMTAAIAAVAAALTAAWALFRSGRRTERRLAASEAELSHRVAELAAIYDSAPVGLSYADRDLRYVTVNERLAAINGQSVDAHLGRTVGQVAPDIAEEVESIYRRVIETGEPALDIDIRSKASTSDGDARDYVANYWPVRDAAGAIIGVNVAIIDITDRKAAEAALAASEARLRAVYEAVPVGIVTADLPSGRITGGNSFTGEITGHPILLSSDVGGYDEWVSFHPDGSRVAGHEYPLARMALLGEEAPEIEVLYDRGGTRRWTRIMGRPVRDEAGSTVGGVVVLVDVDELRRAREILEQEVAARTADLATANTQLEAFAYTVSHDLRAPLRGMEGFARILLDDFADALGNQGRRYAGRIVAAAERMEGLISDLLTFSRLQRVEVSLRSIDPSGIIHSAIEDVRGAPGGADALIEVEEPLPSVLAEPVVLGHVLANLLGNAVKFRREGAPARVRIWGERNDERVRLWVEDEGIGVDQEHAERIFGAFERLHGQEAYPGTGIGLAIVRAGAERMGGTVGLDITAERGARFWLELRAGSAPHSEGAGVG
jgi:PAS domain S-box-containing protein